MDDIKPAESTPHTAKDQLGQAFVAAIGARDFLRLADDEKTFITQILEDFETDELPDLTADDLNQVIAGFWAYGAPAQRRPDSQAHPAAHRPHR
ncbi:MAG: hypothetical protein WDN06_07660 [Asticcacaulis sp.]